MADHASATVDFDSPPSDNFPAHLQTYESFIHFAKYGTATIVVILILLAFFLV